MMGKERMGDNKGAFSFRGVVMIVAVWSRKVGISLNFSYLFKIALKSGL